MNIFVLKENIDEAGKQPIEKQVEGKSVTLNRLEKLFKDR